MNDVTVYHVKFPITKLTRCTNFSNFFLQWNSTCFEQILCLSSGVFHCTHSNGICHTGLLTACEQDQDGTAVPSWSCSKYILVSVKFCASSRGYTLEAFECVWHQVVILFSLIGFVLVVVMWNFYFFFCIQKSNQSSHFWVHRIKFMPTSSFQKKKNYHKFMFQTRLSVSCPNQKCAIPFYTHRSCCELSTFLSLSLNCHNTATWKSNLQIKKILIKHFLTLWFRHCLTWNWVSSL